MNKNSKIYIAGHLGMVGRSIWKKFEQNGYTNLIGKSSVELDLRNQEQVKFFFKVEKPEIIIDAAAKVGGILANSQNPYSFLMNNLQIQNNLIDSAVTYDVEKFIFLGSSCIYPKFSEQPIKEEYLLTSSLEPTNEWYAIAKIAGVKACQAAKKQFNKNFISLMPTNLYGYFDNFDLNSSHVLPAMIRKFHEAKINNSPNVNLWGTGLPMREFLYVDDLADAVYFAVTKNLNDDLYNVGTGKDITIAQLARTIQSITQYKGEINWDSSKPDGTPRKLLDVSKLKNEGWSYKTELETGIINTYNWYLNHQDTFKQTKI